MSRKFTFHKTVGLTFLSTILMATFGEPSLGTPSFTTAKLPLQSEQEISEHHHATLGLKYTNNLSKLIVNQPTLALA
jgi:hypothetical protein